ncbi:MAG TPA: hypothetical protein VIR03_02635 [Candidatus Saccharimonadales bacterium]
MKALTAKALNSFALSAGRATKDNNDAVKQVVGDPKNSLAATATNADASPWVLRRYVAVSYPQFSV